MNEIIVNSFTYKVIRLIKSNDFIDTFLCEYHNKFYDVNVFKINELSVEEFLNNYYLLSKLGINTARVCNYSFVKRIIVSEHISDLTVKDLIKNGQFEKELYYRLMNLYTICKKKHILLNFNSENFVFNRRILYYNSFVVTKTFDENTFMNKFLPTWIENYEDLTFNEQETTKKAIMEKYCLKIKVRRRF